MLFISSRSSSFRQHTIFLCFHFLALVWRRIELFCALWEIYFSTNFLVAFSVLRNVCRIANDLNSTEYQILLLSPCSLFHFPLFFLSSENLYRISIMQIFPRVLDKIDGFIELYWNNVKLFPQVFINFLACEPNCLSVEINFVYLSRFLC